MYQIFSFFQCLFINGKPAYVTIKIDNKKVAKTTQESERVWNQTFKIHCAHPAECRQKKDSNSLEPNTGA
jgi:phospholipase D1/2